MSNNVAETAKIDLTNKKTMCRFPKIELHRHLEGTFPIESLFDLSIKNKLDAPKKFDDFQKAFQFPKNAKPDFLLFLSKFKNFWYNSLDDVYSITYDSVLSFKDDGLHYIELRFNPEHFAEKNDFNRSEVIRTITEAGNLAAKEINLQIKYLLTFNRNKQNEDEMIELYKKITKKNMDDVVGIDLAGDEIHYPPELFKKFFSLVKKDNRFGIDIHAGEVVDSKNIWTSIKDLHADRIGHGVSTVFDKELQKYLKETNISLSQCITSNYQTGAWVEKENHPMGELIKSGVPVSINSDDPTIQDSDLTDDYLNAIRYFHFDFDTLKKINMKTIDYSFLNKADNKKTKESYAKAIQNFLS